MPADPTDHYRARARELLHYAEPDLEDGAHMTALGVQGQVAAVAAELRRHAEEGDRG